jgi:cyanate permease
MLLGALVLLGFQLRGPLVALAPVAREAQQDWAITAPAFGVLTSLPLLCFGLTTPLALVLLRRFGVEAALLVGLLGNAIAGVWWLDPVVGLLIAAVAVKEGREAWRGEGCCVASPLDGVAIAGDACCDDDCCGGVPQAARR